MPPLLFDVFVIGPVEPGPQAEARLAAQLAAQSGRTVEAIAQALARKNLRVAHGVAREAADLVARQLHALGAATTVTAMGADAPRRSLSGPTPVQGFAPLGTPASPTQRGLSPAAQSTPPQGRTAPGAAPTAAPASGSSGFTLTPLSGTSAVRGNMPPTPRSTPPPTTPPTPPSLLRSSPPPSPPPGRFDAPVSGSFSLSDRQSANLPAPAQARAQAAAAFSVPQGEAGEIPLELARDLPVKAKPASSISSTSLSSLGRPAFTVAGASGLNTSKLIATSSSSGLSLSDEDEAHTERCRTHGLLFDRRKTKGCRRCVAGRRSANPSDGARPRLRDAPTKRAFAGFGLALVLGFAPAAYYAKNPGASEVERLRAEQKELSEKPGTEAVIRRFDQIDGLVSASQGRTMRNTLFVWVAAGGLVMFGFYRAT